MSESAVQDIQYQPNQDPYSFVDKKLKAKQNIKTFSVFFLIAAIIFLIFGSIFALNYFNLIDLGKISPVFKSLPRSEMGLSSVIKSTAQQLPIGNQMPDGDFGDTGTIVAIGKTDIDIKLNSGSTYKFEVSLDTNVFLNSTNGDQVPLSMFDLLQNENLNKKVTIKATKKGDKFILTNIEYAE